MNGNHRYLRFPIAQRIEHWSLTLSFTTLAITGLIQKYSSVGLSQWTIEVLGGIESVRIIHRVAAVVMLLEAVYHVVLIGYRVFIRRDRMSVLPELRDVRAALDTLLHNLGLREERPQQGHYTFEEKAEYWALVWGTLVMTATGFMLWNPIITARLVPGEFIPAAKAAHGGEAVLAALAIIVWHFYHVHLKHWNKSMFSGHLTEKEMHEEHPLELAEIKAGLAGPPTDLRRPSWKRWFFIPRRRAAPQVSDRQRLIFAVTSGVLTVGVLVGLYLFVTAEETAITTVPPVERVVVYAPLAPTPFPTPLSASAPSLAQHPVELTGAHAQVECYECHTGSEKLEYKCANCHTPPTQPHFGETCEGCHTPEGFDLPNLDDFQHPVLLEGKHAALDCTLCHRADRELSYNCAACHQPPTQPHFGETCQDCHTTEGFELVNLEKFQHPVPLEGEHAALDCMACHDAGMDLSFECTACHERPEMHFEATCDVCHTPEGWVESAAAVISRSPQISHSLEGLEDCFLCHDPAGEALPAPSDHQSFTNELCLLCHQEAPQP